MLLPAARAGHAQAPSDIGSAEIVVRNVEGRLEQKRRQIAVTDQVFGEEIIRTDQESASRLLFLDGTKLSIGPQSSVKLDRFVYDPGKREASLWIDMVQGVFRFASGGIAREQVKLQTPFANLAIRGTVFGVDVQAAVVFVQVGAVDVALDTGETFLLERNQCLLGYRSGNPYVAEGEACLAVLGRYAEMLALLGALRNWPDDLDPCSRDLFGQLEYPRRWRMDSRSYIYALVWAGLEPPQPEMIGGFRRFAPYGCVNRTRLASADGGSPDIGPGGGSPGGGPPTQVPVPPVLTLLGSGIVAVLFGLRIARRRAAARGETAGRGKGCR